MKMHSIGKIIMLTKKILKTFCVCLMLGMYFGNDVSSTKLMLVPNRLWYHEHQEKLLSALMSILFL